MALSTAPSFANTPQRGMQPMASQVANQRPMRRPQPMGMGGNVRLSGGFRSANNGGGGGVSPGSNGMGPGMNPALPGFRPGGMPPRTQGEPLMSAPDNGMIANNAPSMPPPPSMGGGQMGMGGKSAGFMAPSMGGMTPEGPQDMGSVFGSYPRQMDPRFRY